VSACEAAANELQLRIERNDADQLTAWLARSARRFLLELA